MVSPARPMDEVGDHSAVLDELYSGYEVAVPGHYTCDINFPRGHQDSHIKAHLKVNPLLLVYWFPVGSGPSVFGTTFSYSELGKPV